MNKQEYEAKAADMGLDALRVNAPKYDKNQLARDLLKYAYDRLSDTAIPPKNATLVTNDNYHSYWERFVGDPDTGYYELIEFSDDPIVANCIDLCNQLTNLQGKLLKTKDGINIEETER